MTARDPETETADPIVPSSALSCGVIRLSGRALVAVVTLAAGILAVQGSTDPLVGQQPARDGGQGYALPLDGQVAHDPSSGQVPSAEGRGRVVVLSLDGLSQQIWQDDRAARELDALRGIAGKGVSADGVITAFPSVTAAGHASLWTGAYGRRNGIVTTANPVLPRREHTVFERESGFDSNPLRAEPIWATAARAGIRVVAHQSTQNYPFLPRVTAPKADPSPVLVNGYGPGKLAPHAVVEESEVVPTDPGVWGDSLPPSSLAPKTFRWRVGPVTFHGALVAEEDPEWGYTSLHVAVDPTGESVRVEPAPTESEPPEHRELARHFSDGLLFRMPGTGPLTVAYFRLFRLSPDGSQLTLYQPSLHELALHRDSARDTEVRRILVEAGGFVGNGPSMLYRDGQLGRQLYDEGDGRAERRYLEGLELVLRQYNRLSRAVTARYEPELLLDYSNYPDEVDHSWYGLAHTETVDDEVRRAFRDYRRWAYAALDRRIALLDSIAGPDGHLIVTSDHGMSAVAKNVRVNVALREAGLLRLQTRGSVDPLRTKAVYLKYCVMVNTEDWKNGIVLGERRAHVVDSVEATLSSVTDPETGRRVFTDFYRPAALGDSLGIGGANGCDLYFDLRPGYAATGTLNGDVVVPADQAHQPLGPHPYGDHGFLPTRRDMLAVFIARGPRFPPNGGVGTVRTIDVAPTVSEIFGIRPPRQSQGRSVLDPVE